MARDRRRHRHRHADGTALYGYASEGHRVQLTHTRVPVADLAPALEGLRIALLTVIM